MAKATTTAPAGGDRNPRKNPPVGENRPAATVPASAIAAASAKSSALKHGGNPTGRPTKDSLVPGTPEYVEARRAEDAERKRITRASERAADPPPIPSAANTTQTTPGPLGALPGSVPGQVATPPPIPWLASDLKQICSLILDSAEDFSVGSIMASAQKAGVPKDVLAKMEKDSEWQSIANGVTKESLHYALPELLAKWFNHFHISAEYKYELMVGTACVSLVSHHASMKRRVTSYLKDKHAPEPPNANAPVKPVEARP